MNIQFTAKTFTSTAALLADHAAVRRRLFNPPKPKQITVAAVETASARKHVSRDKLRQHDAHVMAYRRWKIICIGGPCTMHVMKRCAEVGFSFEDVTGPSRQRDLTHFRQMLMWELKTIVKPSISWPEMGRLFGGRDHTTVLHGVRAHAARINGKEV